MVKLFCFFLCKRNLKTVQNCCNLRCFRSETSHKTFPKLLLFLFPRQFDAFYCDAAAFGGLNLPFKTHWNNTAGVAFNPEGIMCITVCPHTPPHPPPPTSCRWETNRFSICLNFAAVVDGMRPGSRKEPKTHNFGRGCPGYGARSGL